MIDEPDYKSRKETEEKKIHEDLNGCFSRCCQCLHGKYADKSSGSLFSPLKFWKKNFKKNKFMRLSFYKNNLTFFVSILIYILINIGLIIYQLISYWDSNLAIKFARVGGIILSFNSCLLLVLVLRLFVTWIRSTHIGRNYLPIDDFLFFHKFIGYVIFIAIIMHTIAHCVNLCRFLF